MFYSREVIPNQGNVIQVRHYDFMIWPSNSLHEFSKFFFWLRFALN